MATDRPLRSHLIGSDSLLVECGEVLIAAGHQVLSVVTGTPRLARWAREKGLVVHDLAGDWRAALAAEPFDWLFAVTYLELLPRDVLALPTRGTINFHDGPLPRYAGLNAPAWALMAGESSYGVAWHLVTPDVDTGDVLVRRDFELSLSETSVSLNTRCFEAAIDGFGELVEALAGEALGRPLPREPQDLTRRSVFKRHDRPPALGLIDWRRPAVELERMVRALDFGRYPNPLTLAKVTRGGEALAVRAARALPDEAVGAPGVVLGLDASGVTVRCGTGALEITEFATLEGVAVTPADLRGRLAVGERFDALDDDAAAVLSDLGARLARRERFWTERLLSLQPLPVPTGAGSAAAAGGSTAGAEHAPLAVPPGWAALPGKELAVAAGAAFSAWLARLTGESTFNLGWTRPQDLPVRAAALVAPEVPLALRFDGDATFDTWRQEVAQEFERSLEAPFLRDLIARQPELAARTELVEGRALPVGIEWRAGLAPERAPRHAALALVVDVEERPAGAPRLALAADGARVSGSDLAALAVRFEPFLAALARDGARSLEDVELVDDDERRRVLVDFNATERPLEGPATVHEAIVAAAARHPDRTAVVFEDQTLSYGELVARASRVAHALRRRGVTRGARVGVCVERSLDLPVAVLGVLLADAAYLPLDPAFPGDRLAYMLDDAGAAALVTEQRLDGVLPRVAVPTLRLDADAAELAKHPGTPPENGAKSADLAYTIYTSGSTGRPKGVLVEHRNVLAFFSGMDERVPRRAGDHPGVWLAVTSLSFDISVLELLWTLARGFGVVVFLDRERTAFSASSSFRGLLAARQRKLDFSLFLWGNDDGPGPQKYRLLLEGARFGDEHGFSAIWTPERHFHAFGGPYPNPSVVGAAVAATTRRIGIRAGSVVLPLHHPIRVAEEWAVVDNLSGGRVGISFASGWQPNDFVLNPEAFRDAKTRMFAGIETVRRLWRGEAVAFKSPIADQVDRSTLPRPVQPELPTWVTTAGNPETYRLAGEIGANLLTHLLGQSIAEVGEKIKVYREARRAAGHDPEAGIVTLMLHTFVGPDDEDVRALVRGPMKAYLDSSVNLVKQFAWSFPAFKRPEGAALPEIDLDSLTAEEQEAILEHAFERYFESSGLFGSVETCLAQCERLAAIGVDEVGCLVDYGVPTDDVLEALRPLDQVRRRWAEGRTVAVPVASGASNGAALDQSFAAQVSRHGVTHLQCTPSMARMLLLDGESRAALAGVEHVFVGGEALPLDLARELAAVVPGTVTNMYGPTETTVWSSTWRLPRDVEKVSIGTPIANTQLYVLDERRRPLPVGAVGELWIAGAGVVRGYHERPELDAERFLDDPFRPGARMYRTGDLARWRADGTVDFLGRGDQQVKIRGYRIELGEIESLLNERDDVREAVCAVREDRPGEARLVAYVVPADGSPAVEELREHLRRSLPEYMVPSVFTSLDALPRTPNGKLDRKALPAPEATARPAARPSSAPPESALESRLVELWKQVLGRDAIGIDDNFFDSGGHSLLVVRLHRSLADLVETPVALTDLYRFPTIRGLARHLGAEVSDEGARRGLDRAAQRRAMLERRRRP